MYAISGDGRTSVGYVDDAGDRSHAAFSWIVIHHDIESGSRWSIWDAGTLEDVAHAVDYLLDAGYVTGVNIDVSGGYRL